MEWAEVGGALLKRIPFGELVDLALAIAVDTLNAKGTRLVNATV